MTARFDTKQLMADFDTVRKRKELSDYAAAHRCGIDPGSIQKIRSGEIQHITVTTMAKMLEFIGTTNIEKYLGEL